MRIFGFERYGGPDVLGFLDVPEPEPGPGEVLVRMRAAGVNPADIKVRSGRRQGRVAVRFPMAVGREASGTVVAIGAGAEGPGIEGPGIEGPGIEAPDAAGASAAALAVGDEVFGSCVDGTGALADLVLLRADATAHRPPEVTPEQAACLPVAVGTAYDALDQLALPTGATLLVLGAGGGVGSSACQLARSRGLAVLGVASASKADAVTGLGARHVTSGEGWERGVRDVSPDGVDAVLDTVGMTVIAGAFAVCRDAGRVISIAAPEAAAERGGGGVVRRRTAAVFSAVAGLAAGGAVDPVISSVVPFAEAGAAVAQVETGHTLGNVVVRA